MNIKSLRHNAIIIVNTSGFDVKNLKLSGYEKNPIEDGVRYAMMAKRDTVHVFPSAPYSLAAATVLSTTQGDC
jgi:hypothetical protein